MKDIILQYHRHAETPENAMRTVLLFGKNSSTYKFALFNALLSLNPTSRVSYSDLLKEFIDELYRHYLNCPTQWTGGENEITKIFNDFTLSRDIERLYAEAESIVFRYVFTAFHNVGGSSILDEYRLFHDDIKRKQIILTDSLNKILSEKNMKDLLKQENQARWVVVEEAWRNKLSPNIIKYENDNIVFFDAHSERKNLRNAVDILLPYQHGRCFYCNRKINPLLSKGDVEFPDVDHVIPFASFRHDKIRHLNPDGIWNLVIACMNCNRGSGGKFDILPSAEFFYKLTNRNKLFVQEHSHSLKNSILISLNAKNGMEVEDKMVEIHQLFTFVKSWTPVEVFK